MRAPPSLKKRLAGNRLTVGSWITLAHPAIAEILARAGFDWIAVDMEHSVITIREAEELIRVIELCGAAPLVRLTSNDSNQIKRVMDAGAHGIIVPSVNCRADAERAVESAHYPPRGRRGVGLARAQGYGTSFQEYRRWLQANAVVIVMLESVAAIDEVESILSVDGVDGYLVGPYDLSASLGVAGKLGHPLVRSALARIKRIGHALKKPGGLHVVEPSPMDIHRLVREGFTFLPYSLDTRMLDTACRAGLETIRRKK